jgi:NAD(P)-dependent dehydrogenase (short-subunit alcohol dehydrogenase family)
VADIDLGRAERVAAEIGDAAAPFEHDIADATQAQAAVAFAVERFGRLDHAVNNAAITGEYAMIVETDPELWARVIETNVIGTYRNLRAQLTHLLRQRSGSIVNTGSITSVNGQAGTSAYNASKHALAGLTKTAALEAAETGVRVNAVAPGYVRTPLLDDVFTEEDWADAAAQHPLGRVATPDEIAGFIVYLLSERAAFITGSIQLIDGGFSAR